MLKFLTEIFSFTKISLIPLVKSPRREFFYGERSTASASALNTLKFSSGASPSHYERGTVNNQEQNLPRSIHYRRNIKESLEHALTFYFASRESYISRLLRGANKSLMRLSQQSSIKIIQKSARGTLDIRQRDRGKKKRNERKRGEAGTNRGRSRR